LLFGFQDTTAGSGSLGLCPDLLTELKIEVLYALLGSVSAPQYAISGVRVSATGGSFQYVCNTARCSTFERNPATGIPPAGGDGRPPTKFFLTTTVSFVRVAADLNLPAQKILPPPLLVPPMPADIFYPFTVPFRTSGSESFSAPSWIPIFAALIITTQAIFG
jgi:hypothetical protein